MAKATVVAKKFDEVDSPEKLDDDDGQRGIDAAEVIETLGPLGLSKFFATIVRGMSRQEKHFARSRKTLEYAGSLAIAIDQLEEMEWHFKGEIMRDGVAPWQRVEDVIELSKAARTFLKTGDIVAIFEITGESASQLRRRPGATKAVVKEIRDKLAQKGVKLYRARK